MSNIVAVLAESPVETPVETPKTSPANEPWPDRFTNPMKICPEQTRGVPSPDLPI